MKQTGERPALFLLICYRVLLIVGVLLVLVLIGGTLYALVFREAAPLYRTPRADGEATGSPAPGIFTGIGRIRAATAPPQTQMVILSIVFPYTPEDRPFTEELAAKVSDFRQLTLEYFSSHTAEDLKKQDEMTIKAALLHRYNGLLHLGRIETLYFNDFMVID
ncbi:MAG: flagellar basal body-associated FliL family protein [Treponema sp.]|jgi:flagellar basal body-associated protein FliL|nr:flagellar basal body-associated FliL family protein [Treponema sp.]